MAKAVLGRYTRKFGSFKPVGLPWQQVLHYMQWASGSLKEEHS
jgi:hypothetical protein